jgi:hypothetical protein
LAIFSQAKAFSRYSSVVAISWVPTGRAAAQRKRV